MAKYTSGRQKNLKIGISSYSENLTSLEVIGKVGIGTTNPQYSLDVAGDINFSGILREDGNQFIASRWTSGDGTEIYRLSNVGIGTTNPQYSLDVAGDVRLRSALYDFNNSVGTSTSVLISTGIGVSWIPIATAALQGLQGTTGTQGAQGIQGRQGTTGAQGTTGTSGPVAGSANQVVYKDSGNAAAGSANLTFDGTNLTCGGTVTANSDVNLKTNIKTIENALEKVLNLRGVEFDYKINKVHSIGFLAQEVEKIFPNLVFGTDPKSIAYQNFVAILVEAIKELNQKVDRLISNQL